METRQTITPTTAVAVDPTTPSTTTNSSPLQTGNDLLSAARSNINRLLSTDSEKSLQQMRQRSAQ